MEGNTMLSPYVFVGMKGQDEFNKNKTYNRNRITPLEIMEIVSKHCGVTSSDIISKIRKRTIVDARFIFFGMVKIKFRYTFKEIGNMVNRDHTSVIHGIREHKNRYDKYDDYKELTNKISSEINERV